MTPIHTFPLNDLIEHDTNGDDCVCGPEIIPVPCEDGSMGWQVIHHSLDAREARETEAHAEHEQPDDE